MTFFLHGSNPFSHVGPGQIIIGFRAFVGNRGTKAISSRASADSAADMSMSPDSMPEAIAGPWMKIAWRPTVNGPDPELQNEESALVLRLHWLSS